MMKDLQQKTMTGIDLGTSMVVVVTIKHGDSGQKAIGVGQSPSHGMEKGCVVDAVKTATDIRKAVSEAELTGGCKVRDAVVGISDMSIRCHNSTGEVQVKGDIISQLDVRDAIESALAVTFHQDHEILQIVPREFILDKQTVTSQPLGMTGSSLEAMVHIITIESTSINNIIKACNMAGLSNFKVVLKSLAFAESVLMKDEREQGVAFINFGEESTDIVIYHDDALIHTSSMRPVGVQLTCDLAQGLRIKPAEAEQLKRLYGCCLGSMSDSNAMAEINSLKHGGKQMIPCRHIVDILGMRMEEVFTMIARKLHCSDYEGELLLSGVVITGGSSLLPGIEDLAKRVLSMPVRIVRPDDVETGMGLVNMPNLFAAVYLALFGARTEIGHCRSEQI